MQVFKIIPLIRENTLKAWWNEYINKYNYFMEWNGMFDKLFSFLGFNSTKNYIGLSHLTEEAVESKVKTVKTTQKDVKISDLMRGC